jgi:hypothetical protein
VTVSVNSVDGEQQGVVQLVFPLPEAQRLESVLRWLLPALEDRPSLTEKQRERRRTARVAIDGLLAQIDTRIRADASDQPHVADGMQPRQ